MKLANLKKTLKTIDSYGVERTLTSKKRKQMQTQERNTIKYPDNEVYKCVTEYIKVIAEQNPEYSQVTVAKSKMQLDYMTYESNVTMWGFPGGQINIHSRAKSLDISRVIVDKELQGQGLGTLMMTFLMTAIAAFVIHKQEFPKVILECFGRVGAGRNYQETPIEKQVAFFSKFGFEVERVKDGYHHMILTPKGFGKVLVENETLAEFAEILELEAQV
jgi:GNAT superfamily N-acetyltransferase